MNKAFRHLFRLALVLIAAEVFLRWTQAIPLRVQANHIVLPRNRTYEYANPGLHGCDPVIHRHTNSLGFLGPEPPADFTRWLSVVAVGGSTTECAYLSDGHTWPELLTARWKDDFENVWVNNAGLDGHSTFGHQILLRDYLAALHPRIILYLVGDNDIDREDLNHYEKSMLLEDRSRTEQFDYWIIEHSRVAATAQNLALCLRARLKGVGHGNVDLRALPLASADQMARRPLSPLERESLAGYRRRLRDLVEKTRAAGIDPVLITQPALYGPGKEPRTGVDLARVLVKPDLPGAAAWEKLERYNDVTREVAGLANIPLIDLARELPRDSIYYYDFMHFTNPGAIATAAIVSVDLRPYLLKRFPGLRRNAPVTP